MPNPKPAPVHGSEPFVRLQDVVKTYRTAAGDVPALTGVSAEFRRGEFVGIVGKSGAGKSTLINMITGLDRATSGRVEVGGVSVMDLEEDEIALWRGRNVGVIYQSFELLPQVSLLENVALPMDFAGSYRGRESLVRAEALLAEVGLADHVHKPPTRISGGQQQRVAIARALANDPPLVVADEPTGNLDSTTAGEILRLFERLVDRGKTVVMVTHDETLVARFSRVLAIADGKLACGQPDTDAVSHS
ncbi:MAG TPA: ABC transporter ATP-binding protein [Anaerolineae bacterium]|nr:ABC transporter ATP-binding protein [Anaerolineae bacterium]